MSLQVAVPAALAGSVVYGVTGVLQQRSARRVAAHTTSQLRFVRGLIAQPLWLLSSSGSVLGFALQGLALSTGPIVLVQPLLVTGVLVAAVTGFVLGRRRPDWPLLGSLALTAGGLATFLVLARPTPGEATLSIAAVLPLAITLLVLVTACLLLALRATGLARSLTLALAAGIVYGVTAALAKVAIANFSAGFAAGLTHWSVWALVALGPLGFLLNQNAFRESELVSPTLAVITVTDPLVGIGIGALWLKESLNRAPAAVLGEVLGLAAMALGVWLVAHRAPHLLAGAPRDGRGRAVGTSRHHHRPDATLAAHDFTTSNLAQHATMRMVGCVEDVGGSRRDRKKTQTREALRAAALRLALERGYEQLTVEAITEAADVSLRTFFNHFSSKDDALLGPAPEAGAQLAQLLAARPPQEPLVAALRAAILELAGAFTDRAALWQARRALLEAHPQLWPRLMAGFAGFERSLTEAIAARTGADADADLYPGVAAAAAIGAVRVAVAHWRAAEGAAAITDLLARAFDVLAGGLAASTPPTTTLTSDGVPR